MYCNKCGFDLPTESVFCPKCGNKIIPPPEQVRLQEEQETELTSQKPDYSNDDGNPTLSNNALNEAIKKGPQKKRVAIAAIIIIFVIAFGGWFIHSKNSSPKIERIDIGSLDGVPELYDLKWGMAYSDIKRIVPSSLDDPFRNPKVSLGILADDTPEMLGLKSNGCTCFFTKELLDGVSIRYSSEEYTLDTIQNVYISRYGEPTKEDDGVRWESGNTGLYVEESDNKQYIRAYYYDCHQRNINLRVRKKIDPLGMISFLGTSINTFVADKGFQEGVDYYKGESSAFGIDRFIPDSYTSYAFFVPCEFFSINNDNLLEQFSTFPYSSTIEVSSYSFLLETDSMSSVSILKEIDQCVSSIASVTSRKFVPSSPTDFSENKSFDQMYSDISSGRGGTYYVQWSGSEKITLQFEVRPDYNYSIGTLSFETIK